MSINTKLNIDSIENNSITIDKLDSSIFTNLIKNDSDNDKRILLWKHHEDDTAVNTKIIMDVSVDPYFIAGSQNYQSEGKIEIKPEKVTLKTISAVETMGYDDEWVESHFSIDDNIIKFVTYNNSETIIENRKIIPIGNLKTYDIPDFPLNSSVARYTNVPSNVYSENAETILLFNNLEKELVYGYPYVTIIKHDGNDKKFGILLLDKNYDDPVYATPNIEGSEIKWTGEVLNGEVPENPEYCGCTLYNIPNSDENDNRYTYSEIQLIKYGPNLPWFGVIAHYK